MAVSLALTTHAVGEQTLADQIVSCGGHGLAMGVLGDILIENEGPSEYTDNIIRSGNLLYDGLEYFYAVQSQCNVTFEQASEQFAQSGSTLLEEHDPIRATGAAREEMLVAFLGQWDECVTYFGFDFLVEMNDRRFTRPSPCGWRE
ncbi:hypothetical protein [Gymnodinialimonas hymeniacidonis]|uniref:hypothetical protein n=1 Tax=Gymnodinialimonas hymeniacidonis TaxID=3126508 RepID=UPI0034C60B33